VSIGSAMSDDAPSDGGSVAAVILNWNRADLTSECMAAVSRQVDRVYVVDNGSREDDRELLRDAADARTTVLANPENLGYAGGCNRGVHAALADGFSAVLVLNNDAFPDPGAVGRLKVRLRSSQDIGAVGPAVVRRGTREVLHLGCSLDTRTGRGRWLDSGSELTELDRAVRTTDYIGGEAILVRSELIEAVGMFDERYFCYFEDVDWGLRARRAGWRLEVVPDAVFEHVASATSAGLVGAYYRARNQPLFLRLALGRSRASALVRSAPAELLSMASLLRRRRLSLALRGVARGWLDGVAARV
jgi:GT2 family glycosyltransferase